MKSVFITGLWRSGTSLLLRLFDSHQEIFAMPIETGIITILEKNPQFISTLKKCKDPYQLLTVISQNPIIRFQDIINGSIDGISYSGTKTHYSFDFDFKIFSEELFMHIKTEPTINNIVYGYYLAIKKAWRKNIPNTNKTYAIQRAHRIDKYPGEDSVKFVMNKLENMVVVELVRDPVYQISSVLKNNPNFSIEEAIVSWGFAYTHIKKRIERYPLRYRLVKYEDLVLDTKLTMNNIASFVGAEWDDILIKPSLDGNIWKSNSKFAENSNLELRKEIQLSKIQIEYILKSLGEIRTELKYPVLNNNGFDEF